MIKGSKMTLEQRERVAKGHIGLIRQQIGNYK